MARYTKIGTVDSIGKIDSNLDLIATAILDSLSRKGDTPNQMESVLDMNSNQIINLAYPTSVTSPLRLGDVNSVQAAEALVPLTYFNVVDYGAIASPAVDNAVAFTACALALSNASGGVFYVPRGIFRTSGILNITPNMKVKGDGMYLSVIKKTDTASNDTIFEKPTPENVIDKFEIEDIGLEGIWDVTHRAMSSGSILTGRNIRNVIINKIRIENARYFGINFNLCTEAIVINSRFINICRDACGVWNTPNTLVANNYFQGNDDDTISLNSAGSAPLGGVVKTNMIVHGNTLVDCGGIKIQGANTTIITGNIITRNKGNGAIYLDAGNSAGLYESNPQTVIVTDNIITDILDRFLSTEIALSINTRVGIKIIGLVGTNAENFDSYYSTSGASGTTAIRITSGILIRDNIVRRTLPAVTNYSDWGFGTMFTRFSTDSFASNGFVDPEIAETTLRVRPVEIKGPMTRLEFKGNVFDSTCTNCVDFLAVDGTPISAITKANPAVVTTSANHNKATGDTVNIKSVVGMTEVNNNAYVITRISDTSFSLDSTNSTGFTTYTSGGTASKEEDFYMDEVIFANNLFRNVRSRGINLAIYNGTEQNIVIEDNLFNLDPQQVGVNRRSDGGWANSTDCVAVQTTSVKGTSILRNTFKNCSAPYLQGSDTNYIFKFGNTFIGQPAASVVVGAHSTGNKGVGIYPVEILDESSNLVYVNSDPSNSGYKKSLGNPVNRLAGEVAPSASFYFLGQFLPSNGATTSSGKTTIGLRRLTTGVGQTLGTDWEVLKANV